MKSIVGILFSLLFYQLRCKYYFAKMDGKNVTGIGIYLLKTDEKSGVRTKPPKGLLVIILFRVLFIFSSSDYDEQGKPNNSENRILPGNRNNTGEKVCKEGERIEYGEECCCGKCYKEFEKICFDGGWSIRHLDPCFSTCTYSCKC